MATPIAPPLIPAANISVTPLSTRPVTNEVAALDAVDAVDAFDAVWSVSEQSGRVAAPQPVASPLDGTSLGSGIAGQQLWAEHITGTDIPAGESDVVPAPIAFESSDAVVASTTPAWLEDDVAPAEPTAAAVESKATSAMDDVPPVAVQPLSEVNGGYGFGEWSDAHTIPASDEIMGVLPDAPVAPVLKSLGEATPAAPDWPENTVPAAAELPPRFELVATNQEPPPVVNREEEPQLAVFPAALETYSPHEARIAAAFDRLADRVRSGEIDVSSIAPEATDAVVLASVLAVLLGGSRSR